MSDASLADSLRPLVEAVVAQTLAVEAEARDRLNGSVTDEDRIAFTEAEAASALGLAKHHLRDARLRGEIEAAPVGKQMLYLKGDLLAWLKGRRCRRMSDLKE